MTADHEMKRGRIHNQDAPSPFSVINKKDFIPDVQSTRRGRPATGR